MKSKLAVLFLIPVCLFTFIGSMSHETKETIPVTEATEATEELILVTAMPTTESARPSTEPTIQETTEAPTKELVIEQPTTEPTTVTDVTESPTESKNPEEDLRSLGTFRLTAYCSCQKCCGRYALNRPLDDDGNEIVYGSIGIRLEAGVSIAVDPRVIPYGEQVVINGHTYTAHDTGGDIKGNRIDVYFDDHQEAWDFGTRYAEVFAYG